MDVDLYVSVKDGRYPTEDDYDFKSDNLGADDVIIRSNDSFWRKNAYNLTNGVVFIVGVKAVRERSNFTIMMIGPNRLEVPFTTLRTGQTVQNRVTVPARQVVSHYFQWFNWEQKDFRINLDVISG